MKKFKVAAVQMNALADDLDHNLDVHVRLIQKAAGENCHLVMFPETSVTAHYGDKKVVQFAEEAGKGRIFATIAAQASRCNILVSYGFCESAHGT
ncbi:MAG: carbon-nitrogen hydrolase family protein [Planctomycetes bacterium]|nr:carbon-nitrogen hydrolase family protein [Planctomycetota bacterium]